ncbi:MAG: hypothetical protein JW795_06810 [Chitinivibrionales bacterium]|nr:hypothetical protein [Chitinivibrionales bacterium]
MKESVRVFLRIVWAGLTLLSVGIVVYSALNYQQRESVFNHRKAIELCDYGLQKVFESSFTALSTDPTAIGSIAKTSYNGGWYSVKVTVIPNDSLCTITLISEGHMASQSVKQTKNVQLRRSFENGQAVWVPYF